MKLDIIENTKELLKGKHASIILERKMSIIESTMAADRINKKKPFKWTF